jgi:Ca2+/Na+ antiporter
LLSPRNEVTYIEGFEWGSTLTPDSFGQAVLSGVTVGSTIFIVPASYRRKFFYYLVHPIRLMIYYSTPDVKIKGAKNRATLCIAMCVFWMAAASYVIMLSLIELCNAIQMEPAVMGLTLSAWAASYPALWSSLVVAKDGQGDIVIGNAFGSNVFSNYIGLGLPWLTFSLLNHNTSYDGVQDGGIVLCIVILTGQLVLFYAMVAFNNFEMNMWYVSFPLAPFYLTCPVTCNLHV